MQDGQDGALPNEFGDAGADAQAIDERLWGGGSDGEESDGGGQDGAGDGNARESLKKDQGAYTCGPCLQHAVDALFLHAVFADFAGPELSVT